MRKKLLSLLVLLMTAVTGAWAQRLYLEVNGTAATLKYSANEADYSGKPSFTGTMWQNASGFKASVKTITVDASCENFAGDKLQGLFAACSVLTSVTGLGTINTTNVTTMQQMFYNCSSLETVNLSGFNTANVTTMQNMFYNCSSLETVDFSGFNTSSVTNMSNMFYNCSGLGTLDLSSFNTSSVTNMSYMFRGCAGLQTLDLSGFNTSSVTNMSYMFSSCTGLKSVNFSGLNTSGVTTMTYMFQGCTGLQTLDLSDLNTSSVTDMRNMFHNCTGLQTLDISSFNTENVTKMGSMFNGCSQLTAIFVGADWIVASSANSMFTDCTNLPNWDGTTDGTKAYYGGDGKGYLTYKAPESEPSTYTVTLKEGTDDADNWTITPAEATTTGVAAGTEVKATYGGTKKVKSVKAKKAAAGPTYNETKSINDGPVTVAAGEHWLITGTGTQTTNTMSIAAGATVTLDGVNISSDGYCIKCAGDATIILKDGSTNTLTGTGYQVYPALSAGDAGTTLTIQGSTGVLNVESVDYCAGIGGGLSNTNNTCGNIRIEGGVITVQGGYGGAGIGTDAGQATCGDIIITGGTITANGGGRAAGIGGGTSDYGNTVCGNITIADTVTKVTATAGNQAPYSIGKGYGGSASCGTVTIGGTVGAITESPYTYPAAPAAAEGHPLSASEVGEIVCSDGLAYAAADKDNLPTGVTAVAIVAYLGDGDTSDNTYNNGLAIAMTNANDGSGCGWGDYFVSYNCVSKSNDIATAIGFKDGISSTNTLTSDGHYHEAATAAASNNGTAAPTGTSGWFLPSMGQWNLIVQGLASKKAGSAVTTDISTSGNDTYTASNLNSVITDAGGTGFNGGYQSSTQYDSDDCWHMDISSGRASNYVFYAGDYVRSVLAF